MSSVYDRKSARNRIIAIALVCALVIAGIVSVFYNYYKDTNSLFSDVKFAKAIAEAVTASNRGENAKHYKKVNTVDVDRKLLDEITGLIVTVNAVDQDGSYAPVVILAKEKYTDYYIRQNYTAHEEDDGAPDEASEVSAEASSEVSAEASSEVSAEASEVSAEASEEEASSESSGETSGEESAGETGKEEQPSDFYYVIYDLQDLEDLKLFRNLKLIDMSGFNTRNLHQQVQFQYYQYAMQGTEEDKNPYMRTLATFQDISVTDKEDLTDLSVFSDLSKLECLCLGYSGLKTLDGIEQAENLRFAELVNCKLTDVAALGKLKNITGLNLSGNKLQSLEGLSANTGMKLLQLNDCGLTSLEGMGGLTELKSLDVSSNPLSSLKGMEDSSVSLKKLQAVSCRDTAAGTSEDESMDEEQKKEEQKKARTLRDASALEGFVKLEELDLSENLIPDISFLASLESLKTVTLNDNKIGTVPGDLSRLTKLEEFLADDNAIKTIGGLKDAAALKKLQLNRNRLVNLVGLGSLKALEEFSASENKNLSSLDGLDGAESLKTLKLSGGRIRDISRIASLKNLTDLDLSGNSLTGFEALVEAGGEAVPLPNVTMVNFSDNPDLVSLEGFDKAFDKAKLTSADFSIKGGENRNIGDWSVVFGFTEATFKGMPDSAGAKFEEAKEAAENSLDEASSEVSAEASSEVSAEVSAEVPAEAPVESPAEP